MFDKNSKVKTLNDKMVKAKKFIYAKRFDGMPKLDDFKLEIETLPELKDGGKHESAKVGKHYFC